LSAVFQPFFFQPKIHFEMPSMTYLLSVWRSTSQALLSALSAVIAASNSMRLLVVSASPPDISLTVVPWRRMAPQPPGPGLPEQAPSVKISTCFKI
jgi:hypothetical protein